VCSLLLLSISTFNLQQNTQPTDKKKLLLFVSLSSSSLLDIISDG